MGAYRSSQPVDHQWRGHLHAARWLAAAGEADQAARLLMWVDGPFLLHPSTPYSLALTGLLDMERGRIEERLGHSPQAGMHYREFIRRYDRPGPGQRAWVEEARAAISRLEAVNGVP